MKRQVLADIDGFRAHASSIADQHALSFARILRASIKALPQLRRIAIDLPRLEAQSNKLEPAAFELASIRPHQGRILRTELAVSSPGSGQECRHDEVTLWLVDLWYRQEIGLFWWSVLTTKPLPDGLAPELGIRSAEHT
jgi:hypothetical protein